MKEKKQKKFQMCTSRALALVLSMFSVFSEVIQHDFVLRRSLWEIVGTGLSDRHTFSAAWILNLLLLYSMFEVD